MNRILTIAIGIFLSATLSSYAEKKVTLHMKDSAKEIFYLADNPIVTFEGDMMKISSVKIVKEVERAKVRKLTIDDVSGVADFDTGDNIVRWTFISDCIVIGRGLESGETVSVYNMAGMLISRVNSDTSGECRIELMSLSSGIYLIKTKNTTFKFMK